MEGVKIKMRRDRMDPHLTAIHQQAVERESRGLSVVCRLRGAALRGGWWKQLQAETLQ